MLRRRLVAVVLLVATLLTMSGPAWAAPSAAPVCTVWDANGNCVVWSGGGERPRKPGDPPGGGSGDDSPYIIVDGTPCLPGQAVQPQPDKTDPVWKGHTDGAIYYCYVALPAEWGFMLRFWAASAPAAPDPAVLARQAMAMMRMRAVPIGIVPEDTPGSVGLVGMPVWLWSTDRGPQVWGPQTATAAAGPWSVTATATVDRVVWSMGDGHTVVCRTPGTPYQDKFGITSSPDCGYRYSKQSGRAGYAVTATSYWRVEWSGMGQSGVIPLVLSSSTRVVIGEVQVLVK